jgi:hypothetical protein
MPSHPVRQNAQLTTRLSGACPGDGRRPARTREGDQAGFPVDFPSGSPARTLLLSPVLARGSRAHCLCSARRAGARRAFFRPPRFPGRDHRRRESTAPASSRAQPRRGAARREHQASCRLHQDGAPTPLTRSRDTGARTRYPGSLNHTAGLLPLKGITHQEEWRGDPADLALLQNRCQGSAAGSRHPRK